MKQNEHSNRTTIILKNAFSYTFPGNINLVNLIAVELCPGELNQLIRGKNSGRSTGL